jgi:hypothetical protein
MEIVMSKYAPLGEFLAAESNDYVPMTFAQIEKVLRTPLPASKQYPAWWSNNPSNNPMTREWLEAGFETESVNIAAEKLVFRRVRERSVEREQDGFGEAPQAELVKPSPPLFGFMKGMLTIEPGYDLTTPSSELWLGGGARDEDENG